MAPAKNAQAKTKTFREILKEKASSGGRIGYDLHRYADVEAFDNELDIALEHHGKFPPIFPSSFLFFIFFPTFSNLLSLADNLAPLNLPSMRQQCFSIHK